MLGLSFMPFFSVRLFFERSHYLTHFHNLILYKAVEPIDQCREMAAFTHVYSLMLKLMLYWCISVFSWGQKQVGSCTVISALSDITEGQSNELCVRKHFLNSSLTGLRQTVVGKLEFCST